MGSDKGRRAKLPTATHQVGRVRRGADHAPVLHVVQSARSKLQGSSNDSIQADAELGNVLIVFMLDVLDALEQCPVTPAGHVVLVFGEHPEDLGVAYREEDGMLMDPASIWQLPRLRKHVEDPSPLHLFTVVFNQCCWGAPYRKPTRLIANIEQLRSWGACNWPHYAGPVLSCQCKPTVTLARSAHDAGFRTSTTSSYPPQMDAALAQAILAQWMSTPLQAKVGPEKGGGESRVFHDPGAEAQPAQGQDKKRPCGEGGAEAVREGKSQRKWSSSGLGPPMQVSYKGEVRALHDGAGLCSPGRWPVARREQARSEREASTMKWFDEAFGSWLGAVGEEKAKEVFWRMAAGKPLVE